MEFQVVLKLVFLFLHISCKVIQLVLENDKILWSDSVFETNALSILWFLHSVKKALIEKTKQIEGHVDMIMQKYEMSGKETGINCLP